MIKIHSWNVNGIRACAKAALHDWLVREDADIVCFQETKAHPDQLAAELIEPKGYLTAWDSAEKKGYSGVANFTKEKPLKISKGLGEGQFDREGRTLTFEYP